MKRYIWRAFCDFIWMLFSLALVFTIKLPLDSALAIGVMIVLCVQVIRLYVSMSFNLIKAGERLIKRRQFDTSHKHI